MRLKPGCHQLGGLPFPYFLHTELRLPLVQIGNSERWWMWDWNEASETMPYSLETGQETKGQGIWGAGRDWGGMWDAEGIMKENRNIWMGTGERLRSQREDVSSPNPPASPSAVTCHTLSSLLPSTFPCIQLHLPPAPPAFSGQFPV